MREASINQILDRPPQSNLHSGEHRYICLYRCTDDGYILHRCFCIFSPLLLIVFFPFFFLPLPLRFSHSPRCPRSLALLAAAVLLGSVGRRPLSCIRILIQTLFTRLCAPLRFFCVTLCAWAVLADRCAVWVRRDSVYVATRARDGRPGSMDVRAFMRSRWTLR